MISQIPRAALLGLASLSSLAYAEDVLGVYIFHRHGDRTAKAWPPVNLTALGADEVHSSGDFYRNRYVDNKADFQVKGLSSDVAVLSQLAISSPVDSVLHNSALGFLQGLYPPTGDEETLANGTKIEAPLNSYQYIPVDAVDDAATSGKAESNAWLQSGSGCPNSEISSNNYFASKEFADMKDQTYDFYQKLEPVTKGTYGKKDLDFENAYSIFDLINVATIHNSSIPSDDLLTKQVKRDLLTYASNQQWNLAFNESDKVRGIAGMVLGGQIVDSLEAIVNGESDAPTFNVQFGAYGTFMSFFGMAQLNEVSDDFYGVCDYASSMTFELVTNATKPKADDISVRFLFSNGTAAENELKEFPLFGGDSVTLPWEEFKSKMLAVSIHDDDHWCEICGSTDDKCASSNDSDDAKTDSSSGSGGGISKAVAGVIGALVTLVVVLGVEALVMMIFGLRLVKKSVLQAKAPADAVKSG